MYGNVLLIGLPTSSTIGPKSYSYATERISPGVKTVMTRTNADSCCPRLPNWANAGGLGFRVSDGPAATVVSVRNVCTVRQRPPWHKSLWSKSFWKFKRLSTPARTGNKRSTDSRQLRAAYAFLHCRQRVTSTRRLFSFVQETGESRQRKRRRQSNKKQCGFLLRTYRKSEPIPPRRQVLTWLSTA